MGFLVKEWVLRTSVGSLSPVSAPFALALFALREIFVLCEPPHPTPSFIPSLQTLQNLWDVVHVWGARDLFRGPGVSTSQVGGMHKAGKLLSQQMVDCEHFVILLMWPHKFLTNFFFFKY